MTDFQEVLEKLQGFIQKGKIRHFGLSNETPWGLMHYLRLAERHGLSPAQLALAFINSRNSLTDNIIGATKLTQLQENIQSIALTLSQEVLQEVETVHEN